MASSIIWMPVSTHSRLKAAGGASVSTPTVPNGFNTQPPEGGWDIPCCINDFEQCFNTQPPEGGWPQADDSFHKFERFNTQPPEGGWYAPLP